MCSSRDVVREFSDDLAERFSEHFRLQHIGEVITRHGDLLTLKTLGNDRYCSRIGSIVAEFSGEQDNMCDVLANCCKIRYEPTNIPELLSEKEGRVLVE
jgi:hypothetical protein